MMFVWTDFVQTSSIKQSQRLPRAGCGTAHRPASVNVAALGQISFVVFSQGHLLGFVAVRHPVPVLAVVP